MKHPKKTTDAAMVKENKDYKKYVDELADAVVEDLKEGYTSDLEPFEAYAHRVRTSIHTNMEDFRERFCKGYEVLLEEISKEETKEEEEEKPPPDAMIL